MKVLMIYCNIIKGDSRYSSQVAGSDKKCNIFSYICVQLEVLDVIDCAAALVRKITSYIMFISYIYLAYMNSEVCIVIRNFEVRILLGLQLYK